MSADHTNRNGLVNGNIPAGKPCPFLSSCKKKHDLCPTEEKLRGLPFDCREAKMHSFVATIRVTTNLRKVATPTYSIIPQRIVILESEPA
jgi:hypothetical protein